MALIMPVAGSGMSEQQIIDWANERLARDQRLQAIEFRDDFPRYALGKVFNRLMSEPYWA